MAHRADCVLRSTYVELRWSDQSQANANWPTRYQERGPGIGTKLRVPFSRPCMACTEKSIIIGIQETTDSELEFPTGALGTWYRALGTQH